MVSWIFPFQENLIDIEIEIQFSLFSNLYKIFIFHISVPIFIRIFGATMPLLFPRQNSSPAMWRFGLLPGGSNAKLSHRIKEICRLFGWCFPALWSNCTSQASPSREWQQANSRRKRLIDGKVAFDILNVWKSIYGQVLLKIVSKGIKIQI